LLLFSYLWPGGAVLLVIVIIHCPNAVCNAFAGACDRLAALRRIAPAHSAISRTMRDIPHQIGVLFLLLICSPLQLLLLSNRLFCIRPRHLSSNSRLYPQCRKFRGCRSICRICCTWLFPFSPLPGLSDVIVLPVVLVAYLAAYLQCAPAFVHAVNGNPFSSLAVREKARLPALIICVSPCNCISPIRGYAVLRVNFFPFQFHCPFLLSFFPRWAGVGCQLFLILYPL
jgi:hypothetical protein